MHLKIYVTALFLLLAGYIHAQNNDRLIQYVCDSLMSARTGSADENCIPDESGMSFLSCFIITGNTEWITDFNGDGENDLLISVIDEGMGSGGNGFRAEYLVVIMKNGKIAETHSIFGSEKFSMVYLEIKKVQDGRIYAVCHENRKYENYSSTGSYPSEPEQVDLIFQYFDGHMVEHSYIKCPMADMDLSIFNNNIVYKVERKIGLNDLYELQQRETLYFDSSEDHIDAVLEGCRNIYLTFSYDILFPSSIESNQTAIKDALINYVSFLSVNTRYTAMLTLLLKKIETTPVFHSAKGNIIEMSYALPDNWEAGIIINKPYYGEEDEVTLTVELSKTTNNLIKNSWNEIKR